jgi:Ca2+-binding RTX toxin-like protein
MRYTLSARCSNHGVIKGDVTLGAGNDRLENVGGILRGNLSGGDGDDTFILATGRVTGDVNGGAGNDDFDLGQSSVAGHVAGGDGNDIYRVYDADAKIVERAGEGDIDSLYARSDYTLRNNVHIEYLYTISAGVSLTGNNLDNYMLGNSIGGEHLSGGGGKDTLNGQGGADILTGGAGSDSFVFKPGDGVDHISDFTAKGMDQDHVNLTSDFGFDTFDELKSYLSQHGDHVLMNLGFGDKVIFDHVTLSDLSAANFTFDMS